MKSQTKASFTVQVSTPSSVAGLGGRPTRNKVSVSSLIHRGFSSNDLGNSAAAVAASSSSGSGLSGSSGATVSVKVGVESNGSMSADSRPLKAQRFDEKPQATSMSIKAFKLPRELPPVPVFEPSTDLTASADHPSSATWLKH